MERGMRTTIRISENISKEINKEAERLEISSSEFIRQAVEEKLQKRSRSDVRMLCRMGTLCTYMKEKYELDEANIMILEKEMKDLWNGLY